MSVKGARPSFYRLKTFDINSLPAGERYQFATLSRLLNNHETTEENILESLGKEKFQTFCCFHDKANTIRRAWHTFEEEKAAYGMQPAAAARPAPKKG